MPWKESRIVNQRLQFLSSYQKEEMSVSELCREFGVSRPTGYRWINRYKESEPEGLLNLSSKPHSCSHATPEAIENAILALRGKYPSWGARKRGVASGQYLREHPSASRTHESKAQEATHDAILGALL
jgi:transposase